jgi:hypothetical protein
MKQLAIALILLSAVPAMGVTPIDKYVDVASGHDSTGDGSIGNPWHTLGKAESQNRDLVANNESWTIHCVSAGVDVNSVTIDWTTDITHTLTITVPISARHTGVAGTGYRLVSSADYVYKVIVSSNYVTLDGLSIQNNSTTSGGGLSVGYVVGFVATNCLFESHSGSTRYGVAVGSGGASIFANCIVYNTPSRGFDLNNQFSHVLSNCTAINCGIGFYNNDYCTAILINCYAGGSGTGFSRVSTHGTFTLSYCMSSDTTATTVASGWSSTNGTASVACTTDNFVNVTAGTEDSHLVVGSALLDAGTDLDAQTYWPVSCESTVYRGIDFEGTIKGTWDVGADELNPVAAPAKVTVPDPMDTAALQSVTVQLSWTDLAGASTFNVYFGTDSTPDETELIGNQAALAYNPGTLAYSTTYYWRIDNINAVGTTTGDVWSFETRPNSSATFYLDPVNGLDGNDGSTLERAWQAIAKVASGSLAGDVVNIANMNSTITTVDWPDRTYMTDTICQYEFTWVLSEPCQVGQFCNYDMWVVGPVSVTSITPATTTNGSGQQINGSMINPMPIGSQGWDNQPTSGTADMYSAELNVALSLPLAVPAGSSLISAQSQVPDQGNLAENYSSRSALRHAAILTCLSSIPAFGSFRPAYAGTTKTVSFKESDLNYGVLGTLAHVTGSLSCSYYYETFLTRPWIDVIANWKGAYYHPASAMFNYASDMANRYTCGLLTANENYTNSEKRKLVIRLVQIGIDDFGIVSLNGTTWNCGGGGLQVGRKLPILFAGLILNDTSMKGIGSKSGNYFFSAKSGGGNYGIADYPPDILYFGEDMQVFYVAQLDVDATNTANWGEGGYPGPSVTDHPNDIPYEVSDIGLPEWGIVRDWIPSTSNKWFETNYREVNGLTFAGTSLCAHIMGLRTLWNYQAFFDYADRWTNLRGYSYNAYTYNMWTAYRTNYSAVWPEAEVVIKYLIGRK